jgi:hypothetical protein
MRLVIYEYVGYLVDLFGISRNVLGCDKGDKACIPNFDWRSSVVNCH